MSEPIFSEPASEHPRCADVGRLERFPCLRPDDHSGPHRDSLGVEWSAEAAPEQQPEAAQAEPLSIAWCSWCKAFTSTARVVQVVEQQSGPGFHVFACADCREAHGLTCFADQP